MGTSKLSQTLQDAMSHLPRGEDEIAFIVDGSGPDGQFVWGTDDLKKDIKKTLADYLSAKTDEANNTFKVDSGYNEFSLTDSDGAPSPITAGDSNTYVFAKDLETFVSSFLDSKSSATSQTASYLSKGLPVKHGTESGHQLLKNIVGQEVLAEGSHGNATSTVVGNTPVEKQISQVLQSNRFNPTPGSSPFIEQGKANPVIGKFRSTMGTSNGGVDADLNDFKKMGMSLMLMASGDDGSSNPEKSAGLFLGKGVQLGTKRLSRQDLDSKHNAFPLRGISRTSLESDIPEDDGDPSYYSHGQVNNPSAPFSGFVPIGMLALGTAMTTTLVAGSEIVFGLLGLIMSSDEKTVRMDPGPYTKGQSGNPDASGLIGTLISPRALGLVKTENNYFLAARRGVNVFFGFDGDDLSQASQNALANLIQSPGYYVTIVRSITRSLNTISNSFRDVDMSNPIQGAQSILGIIDVIKSSKIITFFNVCAALGDLTINEELMGNSSVVDTIPDGPSSRVSKSREKDGMSTLSLAWRSSSSPAMYILPKSVINASQDYGTNNTSVLRGTLAGYSGDKFKVTEKFRLTKDDVQTIEDALEAEYVPFYFHDLRTNEVVSLHAFLASLNDSFSANYESADGYGRIDPVRIYKNTERTIELSFNIVSTSEEDFDEMWWKINKLVTLLYPQWGQGRLLSNNETGTKFIQPFSQIPTASPLIRLRIGDVIKTNSSKFGLARLFGMGQKETFNSGNASGFIPSEFSEENITRLRQKFNSMSKDPDTAGLDSWTYGYHKGDKAFLRPTTAGYYTEFDDTKGQVVKKIVSKLVLGSARRKIKLTTEVPVIIRDRKIKQLDKTKLLSHNETKTIYIVDLVEPIGEITSFEVTHADLKIDTSWIVKSSGLILSSPLGNAQDPNIKAIADFFSTENNYVMKSFESAGGKGLAGVITNMSFDWFTPTWETSVRGKKAPKYCQIHMNFAPIHDIPPGIDESGFNRAPIYNVGSIVGEISGDTYDKTPTTVDDSVRKEQIKSTDAQSKTKV